MSTVARTFARELARAGVRYVFGLPGGETLDLMEGFREEGLIFVLTRHETSAAFMAATWGELTGTPGVCLTTLGPGATNMVTGVAHAYLDRCPLLAISAQLPRDRFALNPHQSLELRMLFQPITKWSAALTPGNAGHVVQKALRIATEERPGPVYLEVPSDLPMKETHPTATSFPAGPSEAKKVLPSEFPHEGLSDAVALLKGARRPIVVVGTVALRQGASSSVVGFCEWLGAPVLDVPKAKGVFPEHHALFVGTLEMSGTEPLFRALQDADLVVTIGLDAVELDRPWQSEAHVLTFDVISNTDWLFPSHIELVGPIGSALSAVRRSAGESKSEWAPEDIRGLSGEVLSLVTVRAEGLTPQQVLSALRPALPSDAIVATDTGAHKNLTGQLWRTDVPRSYLVSNGLSSMGFGLPAAMAAKLAVPDRTCVAVVGDGGFAMTLGEVETAVREGIPVLCVVFVDHGLSSIQRNQRKRGYPSYGTSFHPADYAKAAQAMGAQAYTVSSLDECTQVFKTVHDLRGPTVVAAMVNPEGFP
jgi:acetolactate synthase-1/2/3 large subunit